MDYQIQEVEFGQWDKETTTNQKHIEKLISETFDNYINQDVVPPDILFSFKSFFEERGGLSPKQMDTLIKMNKRSESL